ncbi:MAG: dTMP kinase [Mucinivorans sp.]
MFIVIEGLDGAGKSTQVKKIKNYMAENGYQTEYLHFPRFTAPVYGELIARFLRGELGSVEQVDPQIVALLYAGDRSLASSMIRGWIEDGRVVIVDRYVYSNIAYQCAKIKDVYKRNELKKWILSLEYDHNMIPRPDMSLFLDVPFSFTQQKLAEQRNGDDRSYLCGVKDIHESSLSLQDNVRQIYLESAVSDPLFKVIDCSAQGQMASPEQIFSRIQAEIDMILR